MTTDPTTLTDAEWSDVLATLPEDPSTAEGWEFSLVRRTVERIVAARVAAARAEALREVEARIMDDPMWIGDDGKPLDYLPEREARIADFLDSLRAVVSREPGEGDGS